MSRIYHHIISLGLNCEPSYALEDMYGRLDSYPLSWALVPDVPNLLDALNEMDLLFSEGYNIAQGSFDMFRCTHTGIQFHGKTNLRAHAYQDGIVEAAFNELLSRIRYLHKKFCKALGSGRAVLCIVKNHGRCGSSRGFTTEEALALKAALDRKAKAGTVDLLCVDRRGCIPAEFEPQCAERGIHKRLLEGFAPGERAYLYDLPGWARIFAEFDSVHSSFPEAHVAQRARAIQGRLEARREERLRDIRARTQQG
ncbi:MAG: hypothetical protein FWH34_03850 [Desulfovibrionaceae bacterium]|nr:hypothetical protein [Desulfovibrionaceae bacterium]